MRLVIFALLIANHLCYSQQIETTPVFRETFESNTNDWPRIRTSESGYDAFVTQAGNYYCNLPSNNSMGWLWTWVSIPNVLTHEIDDLESAVLEFDWSMPADQNYSRIGLMFDTHNVTTNCLGGDFRIILIESNGVTLTTSFNQTEQCNSQYSWRKTGVSVRSQTTNHMKIEKEAFSWNIYVNDQLALTFLYQGALNLRHLNVGQGAYWFDNFVISSREFSAPVSEPQSVTSVETDPKIWILLVGIEEYTNQTKLSYTVDDINAMEQFWRSAGGGRVPESQVLSLTEENATRDEILNSARLLFSRARPHDVIITFLSGHGSVGAFCAYDYDLPYKFLNEIMMNSLAQKRLCIVDACHAGSFVSKDIFVPRGEKLNEEEALGLFYQALKVSGDGIGYMLACRANENSIELPSLGHGVFTHYLLQALDGNADSNGDNLITLGEAFGYVEHKVPLEIPEQNPIIDGRYDPSTPLAVRLGN